MPPRWLCLSIVIFWLACNGWLLWRDLLPQVLPGQPPPFKPDHVEETQSQQPFTDWAVHCNGQKVLSARLQVKHPQRDLFELIGLYKPAEKANEVLVHGIFLKRMISTYRVNGEGDLLGIDVRITGKPEVARPILDVDFTATVAGEVERGWLHPSLTIEVKDGTQRRFSLSDVAAPRGGAVLMPLHPVKRLRGLRPGQAWRMAVLDPLADLLGTLRGASVEARFVHARVRPAPEIYTRGRYREVPCLVIDYEGDNLTASTWARHSDGLVLRQEAGIGKTQWAMYRE
jgi:hypothetical protein